VPVLIFGENANAPLDQDEERIAGFTFPDDQGLSGKTANNTQPRQFGDRGGADFLDGDSDDVEIFSAKWPC